MIYFAHYHSPLGMMTAAHDEIGITALSFGTDLKREWQKTTEREQFCHNWGIRIIHAAV